MFSKKSIAMPDHEKYLTTQTQNQKLHSILLRHGRKLSGLSFFGQICRHLGRRKCVCAKSKKLPSKTKVSTSFPNGFVQSLQTFAHIFGPD